MFAGTITQLLRLGAGSTYPLRATAPVQNKAKFPNEAKAIENSKLSTIDQPGANYIISNMRPQDN